MKANSLRPPSFFSFIVFLILLSSCSTDIDLPNSDTEKLLVSWKWVESSGSFSGGITTPLSEDYTIVITFQKDGIYTEKRNNKWLTDLQYTFIKGNPISSSEPTYMIKHRKSANNNSNYKM